MAVLWLFPEFFVDYLASLTSEELKRLKSSGSANLGATPCFDSTGDAEKSNWSAWAELCFYSSIANLELLLEKIFFSFCIFIVTIDNIV